MQGQLDSSLLETAFEWFVLLRDSETSEQQRQDLARWLAADARHAQAWSEAQALWAQLDVAAPLFQQEIPSAPALRASAQPPLAARPIRRTPRRRLRIATGIAASLFATLAGVQLWQAVPVWTADYRADLAQRRTVELPDGSVVELASLSAISVDFSARQRRIELRAGEAYFVVAPDASRPFVVETGQGSSRALGTQFDVRRNDDGSVDVVVTEHSVAVAAQGQQRIVEEAQRVHYDRRVLTAPTASDVDFELAWRKDRLMFREASLQQVVAAMNRYRRGRIFITEAALASRPVTVSLDMRDPDAALESLSEALSMQRFELGGFVWLSSSSASVSANSDTAS